MWLLVAFIAVPMIEIALFIQVGGFIGIWWTLLIVLITAIAGSYLVRQQGLREIGKLQKSFAELENPTEPLANGAMILFAGALLLTPGFFTDVVGLSLLVPDVRHAVFVWARSRIKVVQFDSRHPQSPPDGDIIDAKYEDLSSPKSSSERPSKWTQH